MRKLFTLLMCCSMIGNFTNFSAKAEEAVPVDVEEAVYQQLVDSTSGVDRNQDGVVTAEELAAAMSLRISLDGVTDVSWIQNLQKVQYMQLSGGTITDLSVLENLPFLRYLTLDHVPLETLEFTKNIPLKSLNLQNMPQITDEKRLAAVRWGDVELGTGYSAEIGALPSGLLEEIYPEMHIEIENPDIACFENRSGNTSRYAQEIIYGNNAGTTSYSLFNGEEKIFSGNITVKEKTLFQPPLQGEMAETPVILEANTYGKFIVQLGENLYSFENGEMTLVETGVSAVGEFSECDENGDYQYADMVLLNTGKMKIGGVSVDTEDLQFTGMDRNKLLTADGGLYTIRQINGIYQPEKITDDFSAFIDPYSTAYYVNTSGELIYLQSEQQEDGSVLYTKISTGIMNPSSGKNDFFVDENQILWKFDNRKNTVTKCAEDVVWVGYRNHSGGNVYSCVHIKSDGTAYEVGTSRQVTLTEEEESAFLKSGRFSFQNYFSTEGDNLPNYHITKEHALCMNFEHQEFAVSDVAAMIGQEYVQEQEEIYAYFVRTDGTFWKYGFRSNTCTKLNAEKISLAGDVNQDGEVNTLDVVLLQKWLLNVPEIHLPEWKAADLQQDDIINIFDLQKLKYLLLQQ